jgi:hypothetical protein
MGNVRRCRIRDHLPGNRNFGGHRSLVKKHNRLAISLWANLISPASCSPMASKLTIRLIKN